jgi:hypothetical protein
MLGELFGTAESPFKAVSIREFLTQHNRNHHISEPRASNGAPSGARGDIVPVLSPPFRAVSLPLFIHGLRRGLHSYAATRLLRSIPLHFPVDIKHSPEHTCVHRELHI